MHDYQGQQIVIVGLGSTGLSCLDFFLSGGIVPRVMDTHEHPPGLKHVPTHVDCHLGSLDAQWLMTADMIVVSPGISLAHPLLQEASKKGIDIIGDIELFCREVPAIPIVAVTGSNGKSTVTTLVAQMAQNAGWPVSMGGNIGIPALRLLKKKVGSLYWSCPVFSWKPLIPWLHRQPLFLISRKIILIVTPWVWHNIRQPNYVFIKMRKSL